MAGLLVSDSSEYSSILIQALDVQSLAYTCHEQPSCFSAMNLKNVLCISVGVVLFLVFAGILPLTFVVGVP